MNGTNSQEWKKSRQKATNRNRKPLTLQTYRIEEADIASTDEQYVPDDWEVVRSIISKAFFHPFAPLNRLHLLI